MKRLLRSPAVLAVLMILSFALTAAASAAEAFPASEMPGYKMDYRMVTNVTGYGATYDPSKPAFEYVVTYTYNQGSKTLYSQKANVVYADPVGFFNWFSSDAVRDSAMGIEEKHGFRQDYQYEQYGWRFANAMSVTYTAELKEIGVCAVPEGQTMDEAVAAEAEKKMAVCAEESYLRSRLLSFGLYPGLENQAGKPVELIPRDNGCLVVAHGSYTHEEEHESTFTYQGELQPNRGFYKDYRDVKEVTSYFFFPELPGVFFYVTYYQSARFCADIERDAEKDEYEPLYNEQLPRYQQFLALDLALSYAKDRSFLSLTWQDPVDDRASAAVTDTEAAEETRADTAPVYESVEQYAEAESGEDGGVSIPAVIVIGVGGAGAAAVGAAAALGDKDRDEQEKKKKYKMYVSKDFGDAIRKGGKAVTVRARMAECDPSGAETDNAALTAAITASASGMTLIGARLAGRYMEATVQAPEDAPDEGTLTFTFAGEGGTFQNSVIFRLCGRPYLRFPQESGEGTWKLDADAAVDMILGDGAVYPVTFYLEDAAEEPVRLEIVGDGDIGWEIRPAERIYTYRAELKNRTAAPDMPDIFREKAQRHLTVRAEFADGEEARGDIYIELYPEGLSVGVRDEQLTADRRLRVDTLGAEAEGLDAKIPPTSFDLFVAVRDAQTGRARIVDNSGLELTVAATYGAEEYGAVITENFRYDLNKGDPLCAIYPHHTLPQEDGPYMVELLLRATGGAVSAEGVLPLAVEGDVPTPPDTWEDEFRKLRRTVERFGLPSDPMIRALLRNPRLRSANELQMVRRMILRDAVDYYSKEHREYMELDRQIGRLEMAANVIKWFGDQAFSYLIEVYGGGPVVEAFASPLKDMWAEFAGTYIGALIDGVPVDYGSEHFYAAILQGIESTIGGVLTGETPPTPQKLGYAVAGFMFISFLKHYYCGEEEARDIYKSLVAAGSDLSMTYFKSMVGDAFKDYAAKSKGTLKKIMDYLASKVPDGSEFDSVDMAAKYVSETLGLGGAWIYDKVMGVSTPINPIGGLDPSVKFKDDSWVIKVELAGYTVNIPLLENLMSAARIFCESVFAPFASLSRPVPVKDCLKVSDPGLK